MKKVKVKYGNVIYNYIDIGLEEIRLGKNPMCLETIKVLNLSLPNMLYKIQDIKKAVLLYENTQSTLYLDEMLKSNGLNHLFSINKVGNIVYEKSSLHSTFGKFNRNLLSNRGENEIIFIVKEDKSIIALLDKSYTVLYKQDKIQKNIKGLVSTKSYNLFCLLCEELNKVKDVRDMVTKVV